METTLIVEGPDEAGKTTLAQKLADDLSLWYRKPPTISSTEGANRAVYDWWYTQVGTDVDIAYLRQFTVFDRCFFISERMYQPVQKDRDLCTTPQEILEGLLKLGDCNPDIIFCLPPFEVTLAKVHEHPERALKGVSDKDLEQIYWSYWGEFAAWTNVNWGRTTMYDYTVDSYDLTKAWALENGRAKATSN